MKSGSKFLIVLFALALFTTSASAQFYAFPKKGTNGACTTCEAPNTNLPTYPYDDPIVSFAGRYVDSSTTNNVQNMGMRTVRAGKIRYIPETGRVYIALGEAIGSYNFDTFLTRLKSPMVAVTAMATGQKYDRYGEAYEKITAPDSFMYPESPKSGWETVHLDSQVNLADLDADDRGYVYHGNLYFGWGIGRDTGLTAAAHMNFITQVRTITPTAKVPRHNEGVVPNNIISLRIGSKYYVVTSSYENGGSQIGWDVTNPAAPQKGVFRAGKRFGAVAWSKHEQSQRVAIITLENRVAIYDYESYVLGGTPLTEISPSPRKTFRDLSFDESGRLWVAETESKSTNVLRRLTPSGSGYIDESLDVYGGAFAPEIIHAAGGYLAVAGRATSNGKSSAELRLFKVNGGMPHILDIDNFFRRFYHDAPAGYADPSNNTPAYVGLEDVRLVEANGKTYVFYSTGGLGDIYEIEGGESLSATMVGSTFGTTNPNARSTETGPFFGDPIKFKALSNVPGADYAVTWDFDNAEAGSGSLRGSDLGEEITYQYSNLNTAAKIAQPKSVVATASNDVSLTDTVHVAMKVPQARIGAAGLSQPVVNNSKTILVVPGDKFNDASDGSVESHYAIWDVDGTKTALLPNASLTVGPALGDHTLTLTSTYGPYDPESMSTSPATSQRFQSSVTNVTYKAVPFAVTINPPTSNSTHFKFNGTARVTSNTNVLSATQWTVTWTLTAPGTSAQAAAQQSATVAIGTIPEFSVTKADLNAANNGKVTLSVSVAPTSVPDPLFASADALFKVLTPNPKIDSQGCGNAGDLCTLTASSLTPDTNIDTWNLSWTVKLGTQVVKSGTGPQIEFRPASAGSYTATVTETVFNVSVNKSFTVAPVACGPVPDLHVVAISTDCPGNCTAGTPVTFYVSMIGYTPQACDTFTWKFGEGSAAGTGIEPSYTYTKDGSYTVTLTIKNTAALNNTRSWSTTVKVGNTTQPPPPPPCAAPVGINVTWLGAKGCVPGGKACEVNESVKFTARRAGNAQLIGCDTTQWTIDGSTTSTKSPSHTFSTPGDKTVKVIVSNTEGASPEVTVTVPVIPAATTGPCNGSISPAQLLGIDYFGATSGCQAGTSTPCQLNENIVFSPSIFGYTVQACDRFEWNFGDNTAVVTAIEPGHKFTSQRDSYRVSLKVYNTNAPAGITMTVDVPFSNAPIRPLPTLTRSSWPAKAVKGSPVTFTVTSDIPATGWVWEFDGVVNHSQAGATGTSNSIQHTFATAGSHSVKVSARNAEAASTAPTNFTVANITIEDTTEYKYLLVVSHAPGQGNSVWRTDVQIYNPDPNVSATNKLVMKAKLRDIETTIEISESTYIFEDFMRNFTTGNDTGAVILTTSAKYAPQIWTRTYNQTDSGTFGQFVPAIRIDEAGGGSAIGSGKYYLAGLRSNARYRTNLGFVNPTGTMVPVNVVIYDDRGIKVGQYSRQLQPFQMLQEPANAANAVPAIDPNRPFSVEIDVPAGQWIMAYASFIDNGSADPIYMQAIRASELSSVDYRQGVVPGVGHVGAWRSDVTVFNPNARTVTVDLAYHDGSGAKKGEALSVPIGAGEFLQYEDLLRQGVFGTVSDGIGMLRVTVPTSVTADVFPMTFARTYNDTGANKTYGQGIAGIAAARANVKPGKPALIAGVRSNAKYYTNVGMTNLSETQTTVTVKILHPVTGAEISSQQFTLRPFESIVAPNVNLGGHQTASVKLEVAGGNAWGFASVIDRGTFDPEYVSATPLQQQ